MWLRGIHVENFRSIESLDLELTPGFNTLFGENGTGKTNIVRSVLKLLGPSFPGANSFQTEDYFLHEEGRSIVIELRLETESGTRVLSYRPDGTGRPKLKIDGNTFVTSQLRESLTPIHFPPNREVRELPGANKWNPLGRIIDDLSQIIQADSALMERYKEKTAQLNELLESAPAFRRFRESLIANARTHLGLRGDAIDLRLALLDPTNVLKTLQVFESGFGPLHNLSESGSGVQSAVTMAAIRAFAEAAGAVRFLIADEPETFLHPLAQKALYSVLTELAKGGLQVIVTTHSPHFVSQGDIQGLHRVTMSGRKTRQVSYDIDRHVRLKHARGATDATAEGVKARITHQMTVDVRDGLFARGVILCEGESEACSLDVWSAALGLDLAQAGLGVVSSIGKFSMADLVELYDCFEIPVYVIFDSDSGKTGKNAAAHVLHNKNLLRYSRLPETDFPTTGVSEYCAVFNPDFERVLRDSDHNYAKVEQLVDDELGLEPGSAKGIRARFVAYRYLSEKLPPPTAKINLVGSLKEFGDRVPALTGPRLP